MKFQRTLFSINFLSICVILSICFSLVFIWFSKGLIFASGEEGIPFYNLQNSLKYYSSVWHDVATGFPAVNVDRVPYFYFLKILSQLGIAEFVIQGFAFFILMATGTISMYFFIKETISKDMSNGNSIYKYLPLVSSIFYLLNPFSMSQIWGRSLYMQFFSFALFPLFLTLFILGIKRRNFLYGVLTIVLSAFLAPSFGNISYVASLWLLVFIYILFYLRTYAKIKQDIIFVGIFFLFVFVGWTLVNMWWIFPVINFSNQQFSSVLENPEHNLGSLRGVSRQYPFHVLIRLMHTSYFFEAMYGTIYSSFIFGVISWIIPVVSLFSIKKFKKLPHFKFFGAIFIIALFISLGSNFPSGWLYELIFKYIPYFQIFRNPYEKFGLIFLIAYTPFFALGALVISEKLGKLFKSKLTEYLIMGAFILLICGIYVWPMWTGRFAGGYKINPWIKVPDYYKDLQNWLDEKREQYRIFMTPIWTGDGAFYEWGGRKFQGTDPMVYLIDQPAISNGTQLPFYFEFVTNIRKYMERIDVVPALSLLRTKFLIDRRDAIKITDREKDQYQFLTSTIYPPQGVESNLKIICKNQVADSKANGLAWVVCRIPTEDSDLSSIRYLHLRIKTDLPAKLEVALRDSKDTRIKWDGRADSDYDTDTNDWQYITLSLSIPTENDINIDLAKSLLLEVWAHPKDYPLNSVGEINISEIKLDPGTEKQINEFKKIAQFGNLTVFEPVNFNPPPEFGSLSKVFQVKDFAQAFEEVNRKRDLTDKNGFVLTSQNTQKNLQDLPSETSLQVTDKYKISDTRYWLKVNKAEGQGLLLFSKTFDPQWKVIAGVSREKLSGNFFDDLNLLKAAVLPEDNHFVVNGYANLWKVDSTDTQYAIVFMPQIIADLGAKVSIVSILIMIGFTTIWGIKKLKPFHLYPKKQLFE